MQRDTQVYGGDVWPSHTGRVPGRGYVRGHSNACSAGGGTAHAQELATSCERPCVTQNFSCYPVLSVRGEGSLGFLSLLMGSYLCKTSHESFVQGPLLNRALLT